MSNAREVLLRNLRIGSNGMYNKRNWVFFGGQLGKDKKDLRSNSYGARNFKQHYHLELSFCNKNHQAADFFFSSSSCCNSANL